MQNLVDFLSVAQFLAASAHNVCIHMPAHYQFENKLVKLLANEVTCFDGDNSIRVCTHDGNGEFYLCIRLKLRTLRRCECRSVWFLRVNVAKEMKIK